MNNVTITISSDRAEFEGYNAEVVKEMKRTHRKSRVSYDANRKVWTLCNSQYDADKTTDASLVEYFANRGATVVRNA